MQKAVEQSDKGNGDALALNRALVDGLRSKGTIHTPRVEAAFQAVLRHLFLPGVPLAEVYADRSIDLKMGKRGELLSSSSQPTMMAIMLEQLGLEPGHRVLEIGTGSGYNAALMAHIVGETGQVVTVDLDQDLADAARERLAAAGYGRVQVISADGGYGYADAAPYDRIILAVGAWDIAPSWWEQMRPGGRLVLPLSIPRGQKSIAFEQVGDHLASLSVRDCGFITLRGAFANPHPGQVVQLGPDPGLEAWIGAQSPLDAKRAYEWLIGPTVDWETKVEVAVHEIICGLSMWLELHEPNTARLAAWEDMVAQSIVPPLYGLGSTRKAAFCLAVLGENGLAALMRPPGQSAPLLDYNELFTPGPPFPLFVRQFGPDRSLAQRLVSCICDWDAAGRPSTEGLRVRAYRKDAGYVPCEGEVVVEKRWTHLVLDWPREV